MKRLAVEARKRLKISTCGYILPFGVSPPIDRFVTLASQVSIYGLPVVNVLRNQPEFTTSMLLAIRIPISNSILVVVTW